MRIKIHLQAEEDPYQVQSLTLSGYSETYQRLRTTGWFLNNFQKYKLKI